VKQPDQRGV